MTIKGGRVGSAETGSRASTEPQSAQGLGPTGLDPAREIDLMFVAYRAMVKIPPEGRARAMDWLSARLNWEQQSGIQASQILARIARRLRRIRLRDSENSRSEVEGETCQSGGAAASPNEPTQNTRPGEGHGG